MKAFFALALWVVLVVPVMAHEPMQRACVAPQRPVDDQDDLLWHRFKTDIDQFRDCISAKTKWHNEAAAEHTRAARQAVDHWNDFVRTSLNAPEDFPWPPREHARP